MDVIECNSVEEACEKVVQTIKGMELVGNQRVDKALQTTKIVIAQIVKDWVNPYSNMGNRIPVVLFSTHPRFVVGTRLDYGFHSILYREGYTLMVFGEKT